MSYPAAFWIKELDMQPHPEGGFYREVYRSAHTLEHPGQRGKRNLATSIYFLLNGSDISHFHQLQSDELWYFHDGAGAIVHLMNQGKYECKKLGLGKEEDQYYPQLLIPAKSLFAAEVIDKNSFVLMGCMVSPGFDFADFRMVKKEELSDQEAHHREIIERFCMDSRTT